MKTAILIDGGFFIKRIRYIYNLSFIDQQYYDSQYMASQVIDLSIAHLLYFRGKENSKDYDNVQNDDLYRIFFYDCEPLNMEIENPISKEVFDLSTTRESRFRIGLHQQLKRQRKLALQLGKLMVKNWMIRPRKQTQIIKNPYQFSISEDDITLEFEQKGIDMRIGLDIASIALKKQAERIILFAGDADFVPAAKLARQEGIDFILDPMWSYISDELFEHIDGLNSTCPRPKE